jgi:ABC-type branched-subunit amino acid transport system substrate-binding protein
VKRSIRRLAAAGLALALVAGACGDDGESTDSGSATTGGGGASQTTAKAANTASDTGVTADSIKIAIHASDLSGLVKAGVIRGVPEDAHLENPKRISWYLDQWNAAGGINGRKFTYETVTWDPADPKTFQTSCQKIIDGKFFMVIAAGGGFNPDTLPCITNEGKTQYIALDSLSARQYKEANGNLIGVAPPGAASAQVGATALVNNATLGLKAGKVAVIRGDGEFQVDAWTEAEKIFKSNNINIVFSEAIKIANLPATEQSKNVALAVEKVKAAGATHVVNMMQFTAFGIFPVEATKAALDLKYSFIDISSGMCQTFTASQLPQALDGAPCVTHWNNMRWDTGGNVATDTPAEAQCRKDYEAAYVGRPIGSAGDFARRVVDKTNPGVSYPGITDATGKYIHMDQSYYECGMMGFVKKGLEGAGANLTKKTFQEAIFKAKDFDAPGLAGGKGSISANKPWLATSVHQIQITTNPTGFTPAGAPDAKGLFGPGRCPSPLGCWRTLPNTTAALTFTLS